MQLKQLVRKLEAKHPEGLSAAQQFLASEDLLPVREEHKTWGHWSFVSVSRASTLASTWARALALARHRSSLGTSTCPPRGHGPRQ